MSEVSFKERVRLTIIVKVNIKMLKNRNIKMYRAPIFIPPAVLPKRIVFL